MKRENMKKLLKARSIWRIDRRMGNYTLPNGKKLRAYLDRMLEQQMQLD